MHPPNITRFLGLAECYDGERPAPPLAFALSSAPVAAWPRWGWWAILGAAPGCPRAFGGRAPEGGTAQEPGRAAALLRRGVSEADLALEELRRVAMQELGAAEVDYVFSYRVRLGVKPG